MNTSWIRYRTHALQQMTERAITRSEAKGVLDNGDVVERGHRTGQPFPSRLLLGWSGDRPLHVLVADDPGGTQYVITVYEPDTERWEADFRTRKEKS